jgi:hypothetical protein
VNAGVFGLVCVWFMFLFIWLGWFDRLLQNYGLSKSKVMFVFHLYFFGTGFSFSFAGAEFGVVTSFFSLGIGGYFWLKEGENFRLHLLTASLLISASLFLTQIMIRLDPILMVMKEPYLLCLMVVSLAVLTAKTWIHQLILQSLGLWLNDVLFQFYLWDKTSQLYIGSPDFRDLWWLSFYSLVVLKGVFSLVKWPSFLRRSAP